MSHAIDMNQRIPKSVQHKLRQIRWQQALVTTIRAVALALTGLLSTMLLAMLVDWLLTLFNPWVRTALSVSSIALSVVLLIVLLKPLKLALGWASVARMADKAVPQLQQRWLAVTESSSNPPNNGPTYDAMLDQVASEAIALGPLVQPRDVVDAQPMKQSLSLLVSCIFLCALVIGASPRGSILAQRFWSFGGNVSATQLSCLSGSFAVPRGESARIQIQPAGMKPAHGLLFLDFDEEQVEEVEVLPNEAGDFVYSVASVEQSFRYRLRGGDAQTDWYAVEALERPEYESVRVVVDAPDYVQRDRYERDHLPSRIKAVEGSRMTLELVPRKPIARMEIAVSQLDENGKESTPKSVAVTKASDGPYRFEIVLGQNLILKPNMVSHDGLTQRDDSMCRILVIQDKAPVARVLSPTEEMEVAPDETVKVEFEAHDDHGLSKAELIVYDESETEDGKPKVLHVQEIPLGEGEMPKHIMSSVDLDLSQFDLDEKSNLSFAIRVTDNRDVKGLESSKIATGTADSIQNSDTSPDRSDVSDAEHRPSSDTANEASEKEASDSGDATADSSKAKAASNEESSQEQLGSSKIQPLTDAAETMRESSDERKSSNVETANAETDRNAMAVSEKEADGDSENKALDRKEHQGDPESDEHDIGKSNGDTDLQELASDASKMPKEGESIAEAGQAEMRDGSQEEENPLERQLTEGNSNAGESNPTERNESPTTENEPSQTQSQSPNNSLASVQLPKSQMQEMSERDMRMIRRALDTDEAQGSMSVRMRLKIVDRESMEGQEFQESKSNTAIREQLQAIDVQLEKAQKLLTIISENMEKTDASPTDRVKRLETIDSHLKETKTLITKLKNSTADTPLTFVGLQMVRMGQADITPARDHVIRIRSSPVDTQSSGRLRVQALDSLGHITQAREFLAGLVRKVEDVGRDKKLANDLEKIAKMYEIYVENSHRILRQTQQNRNPLKRKMAIVEVDEAYLKARTRIEEMRRDMMAEFARMLADDPRLLRRYLDSVRRRQTSLRDRLMDATERQEEIAEEVNAWMQVEETQRPDLWKILVEKRLQRALPLSSEAAEVADRMESTLPLSLNAKQGSAAGILQQSRQIAIAAQDVALLARRQLEGKSSDANPANLARTLVDAISQLISSLERLEFGTPESADDIRGYLAERLVDARVMLETASAWQRTATGLAQDDFLKVASSDQQQLQNTTQGLLTDFGGLEESLENLFQRDELELPQDIRKMIKELHELVESITMNQAASVYCMSRDTIDAASEQTQMAVDRFYEAEDLFDQIRVKTAAILDEQEVRNPTVADLREPTLDEFLQRLEREPRLFQQLELGNRRTNLRVIQDWMMWQTQRGGGGMQLNKAAANARKRMKQDNKPESMSQEREAETERLKEMLDNSAKELQKRIDDPETSKEEANRMREQLRQMKRMMQSNDSEDVGAQWRALVKSDRAQAVLRALANGESLPDQQWNKLMSQLEEGLWQVRGRTPPAQYRQAIQQYQEIIRKVESL